ncbi:hypothetical protein D3C72_2592510 [compost metagenome]
MGNNVFNMLHQSFQVDEAEDEDPDNVQIVPVQREDKRFVGDSRVEASAPNLNQDAGSP